MGSTNLNLLLDVGFNWEVAENAAFYWKKNPGDLSKLIDKSDELDQQEIEKMEKKAKQRIKKAYSWEFICNRYAEEFMK